MSDLRPIQQVKEKLENWETRIYTPEEKNEWKWKQILKDWGGNKNLVRKGYNINCQPKSFTCNNCEPVTIQDVVDIYHLKRCKSCSRKRSAHRKAKKWKRLIIQEWLKLKGECKCPGTSCNCKYKYLKFITLTIQNFETPGGQVIDEKEIKRLFMKPFRKYIKIARKRGWLKGGLYAYEYTNKKSKQERWFSGRNFNEPGQRIKTSEDDGEFIITSHHPHVHIIGIGPRVDQSKHRQLWNECINTPTRSAKGSTGICETKMDHKLSERIGGVHICKIDKVGKSLWYVTEYIKKSSLQGRNREPFGILRGVELDDNPVLNLQ